jgi:hypothetical protein
MPEHGQVRRRPPDCFGFDANDLAIVLPGAADVGDENPQARCPTVSSGAIRLFGDDGNEIHVR